MLPAEIPAGPVRLRQFRSEDARRVCRLAGDWAVATTTALIPHPYPEAAAVDWIASHDSLRREGKSYPYAVVRDDGHLIGCISFQPDPSNLDSIGYWVGVPYWGQGYASAAAGALLEVAFLHCARDSLSATHLKSNPASGRVLQKCGMRFWREDAVAHRGRALEPILVWRIERKLRTPPP